MTAFLSSLASFEFGAWLQAVTLTVSGCAAIAALTPTQVDNKIFNLALRVLNVIALNVGKAKNADDKG